MFFSVLLHHETNGDRLPPNSAPNKQKQNDMKIYKTLPNPIKSCNEMLDELRIDIKHYAGGWNCFSGKSEPRGVYVHISPVHRGDMFESCTLLGGLHESGFRFLAVETGRKSEKQIQRVAKAVEPIADRIAELYDKGQYGEIVDLVRAEI